MSWGPPYLAKAPGKRLFFTVLWNPKKVRQKTRGFLMKNKANLGHSVTELKKEPFLEKERDTELHPVSREHVWNFTMWVYCLAVT